MTPPLSIAFFGSSLVSSFWNGAATYYRGLLSALAARGHRITFFEPLVIDREKQRDIADPDWAKVVAYPANTAEEVLAAVEMARGYDLVVKASSVGLFDELLDQAVLALQGAYTRVAFWDVDTPAMLDRIQENPDDPFLALLPRYDLIFVHGGGLPIVSAYLKAGAQRCVPIYNALDPETHHPVEPEFEFKADLAFLGNRLPDRDKRVEQFFFAAAEARPEYSFLLGGSGWENLPLPANVRYLGHMRTADHNAFNCTPRAILNINRESTARFGFSPPTRIFEAAGAGACIISDEWNGIEHFLVPGREILIARDGLDVAAWLDQLSPRRARLIGEAALRRVLGDHTYAQRAEWVEQILSEPVAAVQVF